MADARTRPPVHICARCTSVPAVPLCLLTPPARVQACGECLLASSQRDGERWAIVERLCSRAHELRVCGLARAASTSLASRATAPPRLEEGGGGTSRPDKHSRRLLLARLGATAANPALVPPSPRRGSDPAADRLERRLGRERGTRSWPRGGSRPAQSSERERASRRAGSLFTAGGRVKRSWQRGSCSDAGRAAWRREEAPERRLVPQVGHLPTGGAGR